MDDLAEVLLVTDEELEQAMGWEGE